MADLMTDLEDPEVAFPFDDSAPEDGRQSEAARTIQRGVTRMLNQQSFAVAPDFPVEKLPEDIGYIFADGYGAEIIRPAAVQKLAAARRSTLMRRLARIGGFRWARGQK